MEEFHTDMAETLITLTSDIVAAHVSNNSVLSLAVCCGWQCAVAGRYRQDPAKT